MLSANDMRMFPTIAVTIPINDDQRCSLESPFSEDMKLSIIENAAARVNTGALEVAVAASTVGVDKYMARLSQSHAAGGTTQ
jgi:hypothetical protein